MDALFKFVTYLGVSWCELEFNVDVLTVFQFNDVKISEKDLRC